MKKSTYLIVWVVIFIALWLIATQIRNSEQIQQPPQNTHTTEAITPDEFCLAGCPAGTPPDDELVKHHVLILENNPKTKFADWVAYKITANTLGHGCKRTWARDPDLPFGATLDVDAYRGAHEALESDRGHQAPLASLCGSPYWYEADYLSNITPQKSVLNEGPWEHLENAERNVIAKGVAGTVYSITGPLYEREMPKLPNYSGEHRIPSGYWKLVTASISGRIHYAVFAMDQAAPGDEDYCGDSIGINDLERRTQLQFFPQMNAADKQAGSQDKFFVHALGC